MNNSINKFGPVISLCYLIAHLYVFIYILDWWNNLDTLTIVFSALHLPVPLYAIALSYYQSALAQFIIYYFSSTITTLADVLLGIEAILTTLGLMAGALSE